MCVCVCVCVYVYVCWMGGAWGDTDAFPLQDASWKQMLHMSLAVK